MENESSFITSLGVNGLYFFALIISVIPALVAMILRLFCFHKGAIAVSKVALYIATLGLILKISMIEPTMTYCYSFILNAISFCAIGFAFSLNGDKTISEFDPWGKRLVSTFLSLMYIFIVIVLLTVF